MIKLGKLLVSWKHLNPADMIVNDEDGSTWVRVPSKRDFFGTLCFVRVEGNDEVNAKVVGGARLHRYTDRQRMNAYIQGAKLDVDLLGYERFNKETGRKVSLQHALDQLTEQGLVTRDDRKAVWADYDSRFRLSNTGMHAGGRQVKVKEAE